LRFACIAYVMLSLIATEAFAAITRAAYGRPIQSVLHIAKSENKNQVHYGVHVDSACRPQGETPVYGYWRNLEDGPSATSALLQHEQSAYGLTAQRMLSRDATGGRVLVAIRGFPERPLTFVTYREGSQCRAYALAKMQGQWTALESIYVQLGFLYTIDYVSLRGVSLVDASAVVERLKE
jgi:hypothetical protein